MVGFGFHSSGKLALALALALLLPSQQCRCWQMGNKLQTKANSTVQGKYTPHTHAPGDAVVTLVSWEISNRNFRFFGVYTITNMLDIGQENYKVPAQNIFKFQEKLVFFCHLCLCFSFDFFVCPYVEYTIYESPHENEKKCHFHGTQKNMASR
jgi:hypothetical protein